MGAAAQRKRREWVGREWGVNRGREVDADGGLLEGEAVGQGQ